MQEHMRTIDILQLCKGRLLTIQNPSRYVGGEYIVGKKVVQPGSLTVGMCFPDLYEIGMSNHAMRILYDVVNKAADDIVCDRVYAVASDFEALLREMGIPLYTLDHGLVLKDLDLLGFSVGYELAATNILQVLDLGGIPLHAANRRNDDPIVIAGGPAITNPLPFAPFFDFVFIGEAEQELPAIVKVLADLKKQGANREQKLAALRNFDSLWFVGKRLAVRSIDEEFGKEQRAFAHFVVPNFKVAQDNGVVEIMRGCPNGCRFCHAGQFYKPYRQKSYALTDEQVRQYVEEFGYREITLSSLSSGDHPYISQMMTHLNDRWVPKHVSFALPSLKVSTFSLDILEQLSEVRKSGLTFAIETPLEAWQKAVNKEVPLEQVIDIILQAKRRGWRLAKFYFMVGLPFTDRETERLAIVQFIKQVYQATHINLNINIGTFIPKPHTPFQWAAQLAPEIAKGHLVGIKRDILQAVKTAKVSFHEPWVSFIEGIVSRGSVQAADVIEQAYRNGCRLDAWEEHLDIEAWKRAITTTSFDVDAILYQERNVDQELPWDNVSMRVSKKFLASEWEAARQTMLTGRCVPECDHLCGVCGKIYRVYDIEDQNVDANQYLEREQAEVDTMPVVRQVMFFYRKQGKAVLSSHISVMRVFEQSFQRAKVQLDFTQGYNPKPRLEFVNPLSMGIEGEREVLLADVVVSMAGSPESWLSRLNASIPDGFEFIEYYMLETDRKISLSKHLKGSHYLISSITDASVQRDMETVAHTSPDCMVTPQSDGTFLIKILGEHNLMKALFGTDADRFRLLSAMTVRRLKLFVELPDQAEADFSALKVLWQNTWCVGDKDTLGGSTR
jgi:radical SAM superfamily enzyme YgiQ (UPF0313 family)